MLEIKKKPGESATSHLYRFTKKVQQSGVLKESKKRKFHSRAVNKSKRRFSALHREQKKQEFKQAKKLGII